MTDITKFAFLNSMWLLRNYLADIVIGGGWAPLIYYHYLLGDKTKNPVRTFDIDLMVDTSVAVKGDKNIDQLLRPIYFIKDWYSKSAEKRRKGPKTFITFLRF